MPFVTVAIDVDKNESLPSGYEVYIDGGRTATGADAIEWARKVDAFGVSVILPTSKAGDGAKTRSLLTCLFFCLAARAEVS